MVLTKLTDKRQKELTHPRQRERIITSMTLLKKSVPMLSTSLQTYVKYIGNPQAQVSRVGYCQGPSQDLSCLSFAQAVS